MLRRILGAPDSTCIESLYLELGLIPIRILIKARRTNYLHYLIQLKEEEMLSKVFQTQLKYPAKDDWTVQVQKDLLDLEINLTFEVMKKRSPDSFKQYVKIKPKEYSLDYLLKLKEKHNKIEKLGLY